MTCEEQRRSSSPGAEYFDQWYADMTVSPTRDQIIARTLGLPADLQSTSHLTWDGIAEVTEKLRVPRGGLLLDAACGRGGYGIEVARRTGARLLGVDFSPVALDRARRSSTDRLPDGRSQFQLGTLDATGLPAGQAAAVMCVDAIQFAAPPLAALLEFRRVLAPTGRLVLTTWEATDPSDDRVPARSRAVNLRRDLPAAGFINVEVHDKPDWRERERAMWEEVLAAPADSDAAIRSLQDEGRWSLDNFDALRRVFAAATVPAAD